MKLLLSFFLSILAVAATAQEYVDTLYTIQTETEIVYGTAANFAGAQKVLHMDISYPVNAPAKDCGRPLALIIHGGAFAAGSKNDQNIVRMRQDFAKRGYIAASINYRLGYFQSHVAKNCNVPNWNCLNLADSAEWYRAWYRGVQDAKGALRFLVENKDSFDIDAANVFVFGESAGAYISLGVAFLDHPYEKPAQAGQLDSVKAPHSNYYSACIQNSSYSMPIANMDLSRPDLGPVSGTLNPSSAPYRIAGVGSFYGGMFYDLFTEYTYLKAPVVYAFHQPNDLIVPFLHNRLFKGFNECAAATGCVNIEGRPFTFGGSGINNLVAGLNMPNSLKPEVQFESTPNNADCITQVLDPGKGGHQFDSYWLRTSNLAAYFAAAIDEDACKTLSIRKTKAESLKITAYPNPAGNAVSFNIPEKNAALTVVDMYGKVVLQVSEINSGEQLDISRLANGVYYFMFSSGERVQVQKVIKM